MGTGVYMLQAYSPWTLPPPSYKTLTHPRSRLFLLCEHRLSSTFSNGQWNSRDGDHREGVSLGTSETPRPLSGFPRGASGNSPPIFSSHTASENGVGRKLSTTWLPGESRTERLETET